MVNPIEIRCSLQNCDGTFCQSHVYILSISFKHLRGTAQAQRTQARIVISRRYLVAPPRRVHLKLNAIENSRVFDTPIITRSIVMYRIVIGINSIDDSNKYYVK